MLFSGNGGERCGRGGYGFRLGPLTETSRAVVLPLFRYHGRQGLSVGLNAEGGDNASGFQLLYRVVVRIVNIRVLTLAPGNLALCIAQYIAWHVCLLVATHLAYIDMLLSQ